MASFFKFIVGTLLILVFMTLTSCSSIIYQPDNILHAHPDYFKVKFKAFMLPSIDGTKLSAWHLYSKSPKPKRLVLYFHGNAQNLTSHFLNTVWMTEQETDIIIFDYRGYGLSEGKPEPIGVAEDGLAFLNYAHSEYIKGKYQQFIVYGQSLGGSIVLKSLEDFNFIKDIHLLVLDSTFLTPREVAREKTFWPLSLIISNKATADSKLSHITMPVLSIHSTQDFVIHHDLGLKLFESIKTSPKKDFWSFNDRGHGDVFFVQDKKYQKLFIEYLGN